jgi:hypothetical protein
MRVIKDKFRLVLREPGKDEKVLWEGSKKGCEKKKLDFSFSHNKEWLVIEETDPDVKEVGRKLTISGILGLLAVASWMYLEWWNERKINITD